MVDTVNQDTHVNGTDTTSEEKTMMDQMKNLFAHQALMNEKEQSIKVQGQIVANLAKDAPQ